MNINQTSFNTGTNFKSTYPVVHRIMYNGTYIPVSDFQTIKKLQGKLVRTLNSNFEKILSTLDNEAKLNVSLWSRCSNLESVRTKLNLPKSEKEALAIFRGRMGFYDNDYCHTREKQKVRSYYNRQKSLLDGRYYIAYMVSGKDIKLFEDNLAKNIGKTKHEAKGVDLEQAPELKEAVDKAVSNYNVNGLEYINEPTRRLKSTVTGMTYILQANFEAVKNNAGKIKDYRFLSAKFVPEYSK